MARRLAIPSRESQLVIVGPTDSFKASRIQRVTLNVDIPVTTVDEIGSASHSGTAKDTPNVNMSFSAFDTGVKIFSVLTGTNAAAYPASGVDIINLAEMDAIIYTKTDGANTYAKSAHARKLQIQDFAYSYSVGGESTEDYTAIGTQRRWLRYTAVVDRFVTGTTSFTLTQTPLQLKSGDYAMSVILDGDYLEEVSGAPATGQYRIVGTTLTTGDAMVSQLMAVYHANIAGTWADVSDDTMPSAIRGRDVGVKIAANAIPRVQSVTINGSLNVQPVNELNNRFVVGYQRQIPEVTGTITVLDTDNELLNLFEYGTTTLSGVEWGAGEGCTASGVNLQIELYDPCEATPVALKTVYLDGVEIVGEAYSLNSNQNASVQYSFRSTSGHLRVYEGAM